MAAAFPFIGLVSYWKLDEASGPRAAQYGTINLDDPVGVSAAPGKIANAARFIAAGAQYLSHADPAPLGLEDFTYAFWFHRAAAGLNGNLGLLGKYVEGVEAAYTFMTSSDGRVFFFFGNVSPQVYTPQLYNDLAWHLVLGWHDAAAATLNLQVDNGIVYSAPTGGAPLSSLGPVRVGAGLYGTPIYHDGLIDEVALWRRVLPAEERSALWNGGAGLTYTIPPFPLEGLAAYWALDETAGLRLDKLGRAPLTSHHGVGVRPGRIGLAAHFEQVNSEYLSATAVTPLAIGEQSFTISAWINLDTVKASIVLAKDAASGRDYALEITAGARARFSCFRPNDLVAVESSGPDLLAGVWSWLCGWYDAAAEAISLAINNGPIDTASTGGVKPNQTAAEFRIGARLGSPIAEFFNGAIDEVGLWKRVLLADERAALYNGGAGLAYVPPPLVFAPPLVQALRDRLLSLPAVTDKVGDRIYTLAFPQSLTAPALRLQEIDRVSEMHLRGVVEIVRARVQVDAVEANHHGDPYAGAHELAHAVRGSVASGAASGLAGFRGELSGIPVSGILADDQRERYDAETQMVRIEQDFIVWFHV